MRTSSAHEENGDRDYSVLTKKLSGKNGNVELLHGVKINFEKNDKGGMDIKELPNSNSLERLIWFSLQWVFASTKERSNRIFRC